MFHLTPFLEPGNPTWGRPTHQSSAASRRTTRRPVAGDRAFSLEGRFVWMRPRNSCSRLRASTRLPRFSRRRATSRPRPKKSGRRISQLREREGKDLSLDELDAVAGGLGRSWYNEGCAATVEPGSDCTGEDGGCMFVHYDYNGNPHKIPCPFCGARYTAQFIFVTPGYDNATVRYYSCRQCKRDFYLNKAGQWAELVS